MPKLANLGVAQRLSMIAGAALVAVVAVLGIGRYTQADVNRAADDLRALEQTMSAVERLGAAEASLAFHAYRTVSENDRADLLAQTPAALAAVTAAVAAVDASTRGQDTIRRRFDDVRPDLDAFGDLVEAVLAAEPRGQPEARAGTAQLAERAAALTAELDLVRAAVAADQVRVHAELTRAGSRTMLIMMLVGVAGVALVGLLCFGLARRTTRSTRRVRMVLDRLAAGDLTQRTEVTAGDELGQLAQALDLATGGMQESIEVISMNAGALAEASGELSLVNEEMASTAAHLNEQTATVSTQAGDISRHVQMVAAGSEELIQSIQEISRNTTEAAGIAAQAVIETTGATQTIERLGDSSAEIGKVIKLITTIAQQTNLLALNATIEAARAGAAGKGFAVVASEVKELAQETAKATKHIGARVSAIQSDTGGAVQVIGRITEVIGKINEYQASIASAVEQQTATTQQMSRDIAEVAASASRIATSISDIATAGSQSASGIGQVREAGIDMRTAADQLRTLVETFQIE